MFTNFKRKKKYSRIMKLNSAISFKVQQWLSEPLNAHTKKRANSFFHFPYRSTSDAAT